MNGATHVNWEAPTILGPRAVPRCGSEVPRDTQNRIGATGNFLNDHLLKKDYLVQLSTIQGIWLNLLKN